jgi:hypothetical protein
VAPNGDVFVGSAEGLARWDGHHWQPLPLPLPFTGVGASNYVKALAVAPNGDLVAGGRFTKMPTDPHERTTEAAVMRWNGRAWQALTTTSYPYVQSLALARDGSFVLGTGVTSSVHSFSQSSGEVYHLGAAGGSQVGHSLGGYVYAVAIAANGDIIAGGDFSGYLLRWNGTAWQPLGSGLNGPVRALAVAPNGELIVGGSFSTTNDGTRSLSLWGIYRP